MYDIVADDGCAKNGWNKQDSTCSSQLLLCIVFLLATVKPIYNKVCDFQKNFVKSETLSKVSSLWTGSTVFKTKRMSLI